MTARIRAEIGRGTSWLYGSGAVLWPAIRTARSPRQWDPRRRAIAVPTTHVDDVLAALELQGGGDVQVERVDR